MAFDSGSGNASGGGSPVVPSGSNRIFLISANYEASAIATSVSATLGGTALTLLAHVFNTAGGEGVIVFWATDATLTTIGTGSKALSVSMTASGLQGRTTGWAFFTGRSQSTPSYVASSTTANSTTPSVTVTAAATGADLFGGYGSGGLITLTPGSGYTTTFNLDDSGGDAYGMTEYKANVSSGSQSVNCSLDNGRDYALIGVVLEASGGGTTYTLTAAVGTFALAGQAVNFPRGIIMPAAVGTFTFDGSGVAADYSMNAAAGAFALAGQDAALTYTPTGGPQNYSLTAAVGAFTLAGQDATLTYISGAINYTLAAGAGAFFYNGKPALLKLNGVAPGSSSTGMVGSTMLSPYPIKPTFTGTGMV